MDLVGSVTCSEVDRAHFAVKERRRQKATNHSLSLHLKRFFQGDRGELAFSPSTAPEPV